MNSRGRKSGERTGNIHELVEEDDGEEGLAQFAQEEFKHSGHGVDVRGIRHVGQRILAAFKSLAEVVDLHLRARHPENSLVVQACSKMFQNECQISTNFISNFYQSIALLLLFLKSFGFNSIRRSV